MRALFFLARRRGSMLRGDWCALRPTLVRRPIVRHLFALLIGLLAAVALIASGAPSAEAQNAVGPQLVAMILSVGPRDTTAQTSAGGRSPPHLRLVSANGVAADTATAAVDPGGFSNAELEAAANVMERNGLTRVGRALQKQGDGPGSVFLRSTGSAEAGNAQGIDQPTRSSTTQAEPPRC